uniref:Uncharacterized protein n=1 Tax=Arundo donax TaxID=35708 RepID=A0A0A9EMC6_ARUDO
MNCKGKTAPGHFC